MATAQNRQTRLQKLGGSDFEMAEGQPDIRDWDVKDNNGKKLGEVDELIFDYESRKVRYLVLDLNDNDYNLDDKEVLIPIGIAELHESDDDVILTGVTAQQLAALPEYDEDRFDTDYEKSVRNVFGGLGGGVQLAGVTNEHDDFYNHQHFNDENLYRNRKRYSEPNKNINAGNSGAGTRSRLDEEGMEDNLRNEKMRDRNPIDRTRDESNLHQEEVEFTEYEDVPIVNKEVRVPEENGASKNIHERDERVRDATRNTDANINRTGFRKDVPGE